jgi:hypothetical protein
MRKWIAGLAVTVSVVSFGGTAFAGESNGSGQGGPNKELPGKTGAYFNSNSECSFSGLEDFDDTQPTEPGTVQNWGQIVREAGPLGGVPGQACNGHLAGRK